ncbi:MAG TPA: hypothetical protein PKC79_06830 [Solidesulfovibrio magneticus]|nr:hypothetical protein [Solidesulfovibrio magneticus]
MFKKIHMLSVVSVLAVVLYSSLAFAQAYGWYTCTVNKMGTVDANNRYVYLTGVGSSSSAFAAGTMFKMTLTGIANEQVASLLTAISAGKKIYAYLGNGKIANFYVLDN